MSRRCLLSVKLGLHERVSQILFTMPAGLRRVQVALLLLISSTRLVDWMVGGRLRVNMFRLERAGELAPS
jgi:hypothetical protein